MKNIVFIGNSLTGEAQLPKQVGELLKENGKEMNVQQHIMYGRCLAEHEVKFAAGEFKNELAEADIVVLQEWGTEYMRTVGSVRRIVERINPNAEVYYFMTEWDIDRSRVRELRDIKISFIPAGYVHERVIDAGLYDYDDLHQPDDYHPNAAYGSISAAVLYTVLFGFPEKCSDEIKKLRQIIEEEVEIQRNLKSVLVVGGGGREHAIIKTLALSRRVGIMYCAPGNGGTEKDDVINVPIKATDVEGVVGYAKQNKIDMVMVAPDDPLMLGMVDALEEAGIRTFGPRKNAAIIEGSKVFSKKLMKKYGIPTADFEVFNDYNAACEYVKKHGAPIVVKADGLALGKGVVVAQTVEEALEALKDIMCNKIFGESGANVVLEECLTGREISVLAFTDGKTIRPMVSAQDHKRAYDGNKGPNTGGMGTIAPSPAYTKAVEKECEEKIFMPTINAMNAEGRTFKGVLYFGLMLTENGVNVIEYNARFGDPETQVVLPLLDGDLFEIMNDVIDGKLEKTNINWFDMSAVCVVMASGGYPKNYVKGYEINMPDEMSSTVYHAGTQMKDGKFVTSGGRVLGVTAIGESIKEAAADAYADVKKITFKDAFYRKDIGKV